MPQWEQIPSVSEHKLHCGQTKVEVNSITINQIALTGIASTGFVRIWESLVLSVRVGTILKILAEWIYSKNIN